MLGALRVDALNELYAFGGDVLWLLMLVCLPAVVKNLQRLFHKTLDFDLTTTTPLH
jgi:hypothetical protein